MSQLGADVEQLERLAQRFDVEGGRLDSAAAELSAAIQGVQWTGPDADAFRAEWSSSMSPRLMAIADVLRAESQDLVRQSRQQRMASETGGGSGLPGCPIPGFPGGGWWDGNLGGNVFRDAGAGASWTTANGDVHGNAWYNAKYGLGGDGDVRLGPNGWAVSGQGEVFLGGRSDGRAWVDIDGNGASYGAEAEAFVGLEGSGEFSREFAGGLYETTVGAEGRVGASANADASAHVGTDGLGAHFGAGAMFGAEGDISASTSFLDGHYTQGGTASFSAGSVGIGGGADVNWSLDNVSYDVDFGAALGLGFDVSVNGSFSPSGLADDAASVLDSAGDLIGL